MLIELMELIHLKHFVTIAETMSFTGAAELLHVSQPALSYHMGHLEKELGTRLFVRKGRTIALTADGAFFLPMAQSVLFRADEAVRVLQEHVGLEVGEVRMGCNHSVATYLVPGVLVAFQKEFPRVRVDVVEGGDPELQQSVQKGDVDFAVVTAPGSPRTLDVIPLGAEDLRIIASLDHPLAARSSVDLRKLADEDFVILDPGSFHLVRQFLDACRGAGFEPKVAYQVGSLESAKNFVRQGLGLSIFPSIALEDVGRQGLAVIAVEGGLTRELNLILGKDRSITRATRALVSYVRDAAIEKLRRPPDDDLAAEAPFGGAET
jgi:DNA-binding transcriptional LysR family regulator